MSAKPSALPIWIALIAGTIVISMVAPAHAVNFAIAPIDVLLGSRERSHLIVVTDQDSVPLRFQLSAYRWDERPDGQMVLEPTEDVIFFPRMFNIQPHQSQNVRVGVLVPAAESEKSYRLVLHQLKSFESPRPAQNTGTTTIVNVLTNLSIPVFVEPAAPAARASLDSLALKNGRLTFIVKNSGNAHFRINSLQVDGFGSGARPVFSKSARGWYVLAGGSRDYELELPQNDCTRVTRLDLLVKTDRGELRSELPAAAGDCARGSNAQAMVERGSAKLN
jgi:fimbrial chaperone protein